MIGYFTRGIERLPFLDVVLKQPCQRLTIFSATPSAVAGWGIKPSAEKARRYARRKGLPYISLEDAFIRSIDLGVNGSPPLGLVVDYSGIYYDATRPSDLENLIINSPSHHHIADRAEHCMALIRQHRLSKYNHAPERPIQPSQSQVLVVDQTCGDASVTYGLGNKQVFLTMLDTAIVENPQATIFVKIHPDVIAGRKQGYLLKAAQQHKQCQLIIDDCNPWSLFDVVDKVYTVTSQLGFEALLANRNVVCFGMPFYAGWGITDDRITSPRRTVKRTVHQVFYAAYLLYCRYVHPLTHTACELEAILDHLILQRKQRLQFPARILAVGFSRWKRSFIGDFLQGSSLIFAKKIEGSTLSTLRLSKQYLSEKNLPEKNVTPKQQTIAVWGTKCASECKDHNNVLRIEDGFLRSAGLGANLVRPQSLVIDDIGLYYDATRPSRLEYILNRQQLTLDNIERAKKLRQRIIHLGITKYNIDNGRWQRPNHAQHVILVVGQVESDASIEFGSPKITSNIELLKTVREKYPTAYIIYKPHPDVVARLRKRGKKEKTVSLYCNEVIEHNSTHHLLSQIDTVHTMTSLMGFEALMRGVPVVCYGLPFYAGWGLTDDRIRCMRRIRKLTLDELIFGTLITYPRYFNVDKKIFVEAEDAVDQLAALAAKGIHTRTWYRKVLRLLIMVWAKTRSEDRP